MNKPKLHASTQDVDFSSSRLFERYPQLIGVKESVFNALETLANSFDQGGKLLICGNGGSSADAEHFCGELMKGFLSRRTLKGDEQKALEDIRPGLSEKLQGALPAFSLGVSHSLMSAFANDVDPDYVYAQQVYGFARPGDVVFGISTSGNSRNVLHAFDVAKVQGAHTIALTGETGGKMKDSADICICTPGTITHEIQELHLPIYHALCIELEKLFFQ